MGTRRKGGRLVCNGRHSLRVPCIQNDLQTDDPKKCKRRAGSRFISGSGETGQSVDFSADSRYGVDATGMKRMAAQQPLCGKINPLNDAITRQRLNGIIRTGWIKSASRAQNRGYYHLISSN